MNTVRNRSLASALLLVALAALGCTSPTTATDAAPVDQLLGQEYAYACRKWMPVTPPVQRALFDVRLAQIDTVTAPSPDMLAQITAAGGRIVYRFHGPQVRVELDVAAVPRIVALNFAKSVAQPDAHDVSLIVMLAHDLTDADISAVQALGGRVTSRFDAIEGYVVVINDARVPAVRALPGVNVAGFDAIGCLG